MNYISVVCPEGWFFNKGYCLKVIEEEDGFPKALASSKCEEVGGFLLPPMNEMYTKDVEDLLNTTKDELKNNEFWIGNNDDKTHF